MLLVSSRPEHYRTARDFHHECGPYQLRAVLNIFGQDASPEELYWSKWMRRWDWSLPWLMPRILARYEVPARWRLWRHRTLKERAVDMLESNQPFLIAIKSIVKPGNGLHWISIWGYDDEADEFICYDSKAPTTTDAPGNARYSSHLLQSHLPWWGAFLVIILTSL